MAKKKINLEVVIMGFKVANYNLFKIKFGIVSGDRIEHRRESLILQSHLFLLQKQKNFYTTLLYGQGKIRVYQIVTYHRLIAKLSFQENQILKNRIYQRDSTYQY